MFNEMLDRLTGHDRYPPFHPEFFEMWWHRRFFWPSVRDRWVETCKVAAKADRVEELHAVRDRYLQVLQAYTFLLKGMLLLISDVPDDFPERERPQRAFDEVQSLYAELSARWVTLDDLYAIVAEYLSPTADRAKQLAANAPPPQAWYDEDADPFAPAD
jgi:hypothetical protein